MAEKDIAIQNQSGGELAIRNAVLQGGGADFLGGQSALVFAKNTLLQNGNRVSNFNAPVLLRAERYTDGAALVTLDSNDIAGYQQTAVISGDNKELLMRGNKLSPANTASNFTSLVVSSGLTVPNAAAVFVAGKARVIGNEFRALGAVAGTAIRFSDAGKAFINPAFTDLTVGEPGLQNRFEQNHNSFFILDPTAGAEFVYDVAALDNLFGVNNQLKAPQGMSATELFLVENKISHTIDYDTLGLVRLRPDKLYVTPLSFVSPFTTTPNIQRAVRPSNDGDEVNIEDATYTGAIKVDKNLTFLSTGDGTIAQTLEMNGAAKVLTIIKDFTLANGLAMVDGKVKLNTGDLILLATAPAPSGGGQGTYVITSGTGTLTQRGIGTGKDTVNYLIGSENSYLPIGLRNRGTTDEYRFRVIGDNFRDGLSGPAEDSVVSATWFLSEAVSGGGDLNISPQWNQSDEKQFFDRTRCIAELYVSPKWGPFSKAILKNAYGNNPFGITESGVANKSFNNTPIRVFSYLPPNDLYIPTFFSPNGDTRNDNLLLYSQVLGNVSFKIYNRWGNVVYETNDPIEATTKGWDGKFDGKEANTDTYVWKITGTFRDGKPLTANGKSVGYILLSR